MTTDKADPDGTALGVTTWHYAVCLGISVPTYRVVTFKNKCYYHISPKLGHFK